ncbi:MAG: rhomboid family intramembrane serine protease [Actinomycetota bacterium]|nr:rhomboid family intramembrane serine protease [Actinomycetota bacterium]
MAVGALVCVLWVVEAIDALMSHRLDTWGISPRMFDELPDIFTAPFLHAGFGHLAANSVPVAVLGFLAALRGLGRFLAVSAVIIVVSGLGVWLTSPVNTVTIGASGLVFGYLGYVLVRGFVDRRSSDIVIGLVVAIVYGSVLLGVLPGQRGISWQGHLFGLIGGVLAAWLFRTRRLRQSREVTVRTG